jgi:hypothetical protein
LLVLIGFLIGSLVTIPLVSPVPPVAAQATLEVTNGDDSGAGSLRQAIADAAAGDIITFADNVTTVTLTSDQLTIDKDLTIDGGATGVTVERADTADAFRIFEISGGTVTLDSLTIRNGFIRSVLFLTLHGGGISISGGTVNITNSTLRDNRTSGVTTLI